MLRPLRSRPLVRQILAAWLLAWLGMIALPVFGTPTGAWVCHGAGGVRLVFVKAWPDGHAGTHAKAMQDNLAGTPGDCPLCGGAALSEPPRPLLAAEPERLSHVLQGAVAAHLKRLASAHFVARGPPTA